MRVLFSSLSPARQRLIRYMHKMQFGAITDLPVVDGEPQLSKATKAKKRRMMSRPIVTDLLGDDFALKQEQIVFMNTLDEIFNGVIPLIEVSHGLATTVVSEEFVSDEVVS